MARNGRPQERELVIGISERNELERIARSRSAAHGLVRRAEIILASAGGEAALRNTSPILPIKVITDRPGNSSRLR